MRYALVLLLALLSAGCATKPVAPSSAQPVPSDRLLAFQAPSAEAGTLIVTRDSGFLGGGCFTGLMINGQLAGRFAAEETATFHVPAGELLFRYGTDPQGRGLCGVGQDHWTQRESSISAGETKKFRLSLSPDGIPDIQRAD